MPDNVGFNRQLNRQQEPAHASPDSSLLARPRVGPFARLDIWDGFWSESEWALSEPVARGTEIAEEVAVGKVWLDTRDMFASGNGRAARDQTASSRLPSMLTTVSMRGTSIWMRLARPQ